MSPSDRNCCNFGISEKRIVHGYSNCAIMTILEMMKLIFDEHICWNYGNSKNNIMNFSAHNCCNYGNSEKDVA